MCDHAVAQVQIMLQPMENFWLLGNICFLVPRQVTTGELGLNLR